MARPQKTATLTEEQIERLASIGCTDHEIAALAGLSETEIKRSFGPLLKSGRGKLRERLRSAQVARALDGSDTMLIWLGKQYLEQRDKHDNANTHSGPSGGPIPIAIDRRAALAGVAPRSVRDSDAPGDD